VVENFYVPSLHLLLVVMVFVVTGLGGCLRRCFFILRSDLFHLEIPWNHKRCPGVEDAASPNGQPVTSMHADVLTRCAKASSYQLKDERRLLCNPDGSHSHTSAHTHRGDADLLAPLLELGQQRANLSGSSAAQWMAESDRSTFRVDLFLRKL